MKWIVAVAVFIVSVLGDNETLEQICGRNKIGQSGWDQSNVKPEEWPWHVLVRSTYYDEYFDGTLISKNLVLTVASSISKHETGVKPKDYTIILNPNGTKHEEREVDKVIIFEPFNLHYKIHDIAILRLKTNVDFNDSIQPACVWSKSVTSKYTLPSYKIGAVVGYETIGSFDHIKMTSLLRKTTMAIVSSDECNKNKTVYSKDYATNDKFCAENLKDNTVCIDDIGAPYQVFVPDNPKATYGSGAWYVRGLLQRTPVKGPPFACKPDDYFIFTDIEKHYEWIALQLQENK